MSTDGSHDFGLGPRGTAFYEAVVGGKPVDAARETVIVEAARMADRLEQMNDVIKGKGVLNLLHFRMPYAMDAAEGVVQVEMTIDHVMGEARQLQLALERVVKGLSLPDVSAVVKVDKSDDLASKRAARRSASG